MSSISSIAANAQFGIQQALSRFDNSAQRTARSATDPSVDPAQEVVEQVSAKTAAEANFKVMATANDMLGSLLDIKA